MDYCLDVKKFKQSLAEVGYESLSAFSLASKIHRNTLQGLLAGKQVFVASFLDLAAQLKKDPLELLSVQSSLSVKISYIEELRPILPQLLKLDPKIAIVLLGSRARGNAKKYSDWDLGLFRYPEPLSGREYLRLKRVAEDESENLVRKIDVINLNQAPLWFLQGVKQDVVFLDGVQESFLYLKGMLDGIQKEQAA